MSKIEKLTPEQEAKLGEWRETWLRVGLSTEPADRPTAERAVAEAYRDAGFDPPKLVIWLRSPLEGCIGTALLADHASKAVWAQVGAQVWAQVANQRYRAGYGLHDASWIGWMDFFRVVVGLDIAKAISITELTRACGWWWPFKGAVILTERPRFISRDDRNRLHCEDRAALEYPDGWGVYSWHGVRVPADVILKPGSITWQQIDAEKNSEIRRVLLERFGAKRYLEESGAKEVHADKWGTLFRKEVDGDEPILMVRVINSTPEPDGTKKVYWLRVPPDIKTARGAVAWTFGKEPLKYAPRVET